MLIGIGVAKLKHEQEEDNVNGGGSGDESVAALYLHGDILESIVSHVPTADLSLAARVSHEWRRAVRDALRSRPRRTPWLLLHIHSRRAARVHAYDPHSGTWLSVQSTRHVTPSHVRVIRGGRLGDRLFSLSLSGMSIAADPLNASWHGDIPGPRVWRVDPVVAVVGTHVVAIGGVCDLALGDDEEAGAVEVHDGNGTAWASCEPMPAAFLQSAAATWLSSAATERRAYVTERRTGYTSWFDPVSRKWGPTRRLRPDASVSTWAIAVGRGGEKLVLVGVKQVGEEAKKRVLVKMWEMEGETLEVAAGVEEEMPREMAERLFLHNEDGDDDDDDEEMTLSIGMCGYASGGYGGGYVYNAAKPMNGAVLYELSATAERIVKRWEWVPCPPVMKANPLDRAMFACSPVALDELDQVRSLLAY